MTSRDVQYLKRATPAELIKLTRDIPWELCAWIKVELTNSKALTFQQICHSVTVEQRKWVAAGAAPSDPDARVNWLKTRSHVLYPCVECQSIKYPYPKPGRRYTFTRDQGFALMYLCGNCAVDFDHYHYPLKLAATMGTLAARWQGRCLTPKAAAQ
jgi:hypothetical protein